MTPRPPGRRLLSVALAVCLAGNGALAPAVLAQGEAVARASTARLGADAVLSYSGGKMAPELVALAAERALVTQRAKALYLLVLLRLAHLFVGAQGRTPTDAETSQALAPLAHVSLTDTALDIGEFMAASAFGKATEQILTRRYPTTTFPAKLLTKVKSYGPIFAAWAVVNGVQDQVKEGRWSDGLTWGVARDLAVRVGGELLTLVAVVAALKLLGYPFKLLGKLAGEKVLARFATLRIVTNTVGAVASRVLSFASAAGWIALGVMVFYPMAEKAYAAEQTRQLRRLAGQQVEYRNRLLRIFGSRRGEELASKLPPGDARILANAYLTDHDPFAASKFELLVQLGDANNLMVEEKLAELKRLHLSNLEDRAAKRPGEIEKRKARIESIKNEVRAVFGGGRPSFFDLDGLPAIGERAALEAEAGRLQSVNRQVGNMVRLPPELDQLVSRTETLLEKSLADRAAADLRGMDGEARTARAEQLARAAEDRVWNVRSMMEDEIAELKGYCQKRLAQIEKLSTQFPTEGEAAAEAGLTAATFEAIEELTSPEGRNGAEVPAGFDGLEGR